MPEPRRIADAFRKIRRIAGRGSILCVIVFVVLAFVTTDQFRAFGGSPKPETYTLMRASPQFNRDHFENGEPTDMMKVGTFTMLQHWWNASDMRSPTCALPLALGIAARLRETPGSGLRVTWLGHSTALIEIDGHRVLTDPIWSERASPSTIVGPKRFHPPPLALAELPRIDAVVVSHDHYDHLDMETARMLAARGTPFHVPLGLGAHLARWGVPSGQIFEHDWWERQRIGAIELVSTPARHFYGRGVPGRVGSLWTSWSIIGPEHRVFFSGDTGLTEGFREIGKREGPFDVALLEIGQHHPDWGDIHLGPEGALEAYAMLGAKHLLPIHWSTFELAYHAWSEPAETLVSLAKTRAVSGLLTPKLGEPIEPTSSPPTAPWWRALPPLAARCPER